MNYYFPSRAPPIKSLPQPFSARYDMQSKAPYENPAQRYDLDVLDEPVVFPAEKPDPCSCQGTCQQGSCIVDGKCPDGKQPRILGVPIPFTPYRRPCGSLEDFEAEALRTGGKRGKKKKIVKKKKTTTRKTARSHYGGYFTTGYGHHLQHPQFLYHHPASYYHYKHQCRCGSLTGCHCGWYPTIKTKSKKKEPKNKRKGYVSASSSTSSTSYYSSSS
jgi:hypothetical protein